MWELCDAAASPDAAWWGSARASFGLFTCGRRSSPDWGTAVAVGWLRRALASSSHVPVVDVLIVVCLSCHFAHQLVSQPVNDMRHR